MRSFLQSNHLADDGTPNRWNLESLNAVAFYYHPDLDVARARWGIAKAGMITAGERPNPTVGFTPGFNSTTPSSISPWILTFDLDIPIETFGKRGYRIAQAKNRSESARLEIATVAWQVRSRVRQSMIDLYSAEKMVSLLKEQESIQKEIVQLLEYQLDAGAVSPAEVTRGRIALNTVTLSLIDAKKTLAEDHILLADSLGVPAKSLENIELSFEGLDPGSTTLPSDESLHHMLLNRSDVLSLLAEYAADQNALQLEIAKQYPDVNIGPGYELDQTDNKWSIGLSVSLPVFNQNQGAMAEAEAKREETAARFLALQSRIVSETGQAEVAYRYAVEKLDAAETILHELQQQEQTTGRMYEAGEVSRLAVAAAQLEVNTGSIARLDALVNVQQTLGDLEDAVQQPIGSRSPSWIDPEMNHREMPEKNDE